MEIASYILGGALVIAIIVSIVLVLAYNERKDMEAVLFALAQGPLTESEMRKKLNIHSDQAVTNLNMLLEHMVKHKLVTHYLDKNEESCYILTPQGTARMWRILSP